ncbi:hypothetical protein JNW88_11070 [Micromonospora sp. ATA32]|nr:hypothetical protein [Micromonospora sp. ATA32]
MSETGQPGAATPGDHGDGPGQQDDLARPVSGWAPSAAGWSRGGEAAAPREPLSPWRQPDPTAGWGASSPQHGDLPAPLPGPPGDTDPPVRLNGRSRVNGVTRAGAESPVSRQTPVSAPPGPVDEPSRNGESPRNGEQVLNGESPRDGESPRNGEQFRSGESRLSGEQRPRHRG